MLDEKLFKKIKTIEIPEYIYQIKLSEKQRCKYYSTIPGRNRVTKITKWAEKLIKGTDENGYYIGADGGRIISNFRNAGTPKMLNINGQLFYSQNGGEFTRAKVVTELHAFYKPFVEAIKKIKKEHYPLVITYNWFCPYEHKTLDNFNWATAYVKTFEDVLTNLGVIEDDEVRFMTGSFPIYTPVEKIEDRKIVIDFWQDNRQEIQQLKLKI